MSEKLCPATGWAKSNELPPSVCVQHVFFTLRVSVYTPKKGKIDYGENPLYGFAIKLAIVPRCSLLPGIHVSPIDSHAPSSQCMPVHPSASHRIQVHPNASHCMRLHQAPSDSIRLSSTCKNWRSMENIESSSPEISRAIPGRSLRVDLEFLGLDPKF